MNKYDEKWDYFLDPENLGISLKFISLFIAIYENFKFTIVDDVKYLYWSGYKNGVECFNNYEEQVLNKVKSKKNKQLKATLLWLKESGAITEQDVLLFKRITDKRNELTHNMTTVIFEGLDIKDLDLYLEMISLYEKIEMWWIKEIEVPTNPDISPEQYDSIDWSGVKSMKLEMLKVMADIAINENSEYLKTFMSKKN